MPVTIELPDLKSQSSFNLARWQEILADPRLATLPERIETDRHGRIIMTPPRGFLHADRQGHIADLLKDLLPDGRVLAECPLSTADGVKAIDLAWLSKGRVEFRERPLVLTSAPEICIEVLSPSNTAAEIDKNAPSISMPEPPRSGSATSRAPYLSFLPLTIRLLARISPRSSLTGFGDVSASFFLQWCRG